MNVAFTFTTWNDTTPDNIHVICHLTPDDLPLTPHLNIDLIKKRSIYVTPSTTDLHSFFSTHVIESFTTIPVAIHGGITHIIFRCVNRDRLISSDRSFRFSEHYDLTYFVLDGYIIYTVSLHEPERHHVNGVFTIPEPIPLIIDHHHVETYPIADAGKESGVVESVAMVLPPNSLIHHAIPHRSSYLNGLANWDVRYVVSLKDFFVKSRVKSLAFASKWDVSNVKTMSMTFYHCSKLRSLNGLERWNVSNVTSMEAAFDGCKRLRSLSAIKDWDVSSVVVMSYMFNQCKSITTIDDVCDWDYSAVASATNMFAWCIAIETPKGFERWNMPENVIKSDNLFEYCYGLNVYVDMVTRYEKGEGHDPEWVYDLLEPLTRAVNEYEDE